MEKTIHIGEEISFPAKSTAASLFSYKRNFGRDMMKDIISLASAVPDKKLKDEEIIDIIATDRFDFDVFFRLLWIFAKAGDPAIPEMEEWLERFDIAPLDFAVEVLPQIQDLMISNVKTTVKPKKKDTRRERNGHNGRHLSDRHRARIDRRRF